MRSHNFIIVKIIIEILFLDGLIQDVLGGLKCPGRCVVDPASCRLLGGKIIGYCINGQACCDLSQMEGGSCDTTVRNAKVSYFMSPNYPNESGGDLICELNLELSEKTLGVKLDFVSLQMDSLPFDLADFAVSQTPVCGSDMLFIKGFQGWSPDLRCGNLTGYSILVETEKGQKKLSLVFVMASSIYKWRIRLTQFTEDDVNSRGNSIVSNKITNLHNTDDHSNDGNGITGFQKNYDDTGYANTIQEENSEGEPMLRIAGGEDAEKFSIPWQVSIQSVQDFESHLCGVPGRNMTVHLCGGSIIDERTVLTSAHCFYSPSRFAHPTLSVDQIKVVVGELDLCQTNETSFTRSYSVSQVILHFNYFAKEILNDLAIIKLKEPIEFNHGVKPITLADTDFEISDKPTLLAGWGSYSLEENMTYPSTLQKTTNLVLFAEKECVERQTAYLNYNKNLTNLSKKYEGVFDRGLCGRGKSKEVEAGFGDSGGGLVVTLEKSSPILIGVVSHMRAEIDFKTNETFHLDYFVKVSAFKKWILMGML
ncbi:Chymotrypsin-like protease CTRL-1 [Folsomia candida]|uniref:Chymotrypsin-like protease CTRL-1 n=1 Tax=Folsomia candida TaxID=158441 RepID=A0A226F167_FOLCA|nr:Chymotrypsin-like protease CTRL-1 [Folsomia candida]